MTQYIHTILLADYKLKHLEDDGIVRAQVKFIFTISQIQTNLSLFLTLIIGEEVGLKVEGLLMQGRKNL